MWNKRRLTFTSLSQKKDELRKIRQRCNRVGVKEVSVLESQVSVLIGCLFNRRVHTNRCSSKRRVSLVREQIALETFLS